MFSELFIFLTGFFLLLAIRLELREANRLKKLELKKAGFSEEEIKGK
jgi:hypothetical protein